MDKIKLVLDVFKKYLFWLLFVVTVVVVLVCWWLSTASLAKSFQQQKSKVEKKFTDVKAISDDAQHPTPEYIRAIKNEDENGKLKDCKLKDLKEGVLSVWKTLYDEQNKNNVWPNVLGKQFLDTITAIDQKDPNGAIPDDLRDRYRYVIKNYFPELEKTIDVRHPPAGAEGEGGAAAGAPALINRFMRPGMFQPGRARTQAAADTADWIGTVEWDESDRTRLKDHYRWDKTPDSDVIRLRQEDLWVYRTLLEAIRETNTEGAAKEPVIVPNVKRIEWIEIGPDAIAAWTAADQTVFKAAAVDAAAAAAAAAANPRAAPTATPGRDTAAAPAGDSKEQLLKDRYVDDKGAPLEADAKGPYSEFKMMPISLKLHVDQRKISKLLVACVNSPMPIEVRRVRIRPGSGEMFDPGTAAAAAGAAAPARDNYRRVETRGAGRMPGGPAAAGEESETGSYDIPVEIQGIIYIYNPPDVNVLGTGTAAEKPPENAAGAAPAADAAKPADAPPAK